MNKCLAIGPTDHLDQFQLMKCYHFNLFIYLLTEFYLLKLTTYFIQSQTSFSFWKSFDLNIKIYSQIYIVPVSPQGIAYSLLKTFFPKISMSKIKTNIF